MIAKIVKRNKLNEFFIDEGCFITEISNSPDDNPMSIALARVEPGVTTKKHFLDNTEERYLIVSGHGLMELGDDPPVPVGPSDSVFIPAGVNQNIKNTGLEDLIFYCICTPRFAAGCYREPKM